jgi:hypothetical protein
VSNTWVMYLSAGDNNPKGLLIPHTPVGAPALIEKGGLSAKLPPIDQPASHQLVGEVMAHQGLDG